MSAGVVPFNLLAIDAPGALALLGADELRLCLQSQRMLLTRMPLIACVSASVSWRRMSCPALMALRNRLAGSERGEEDARRKGITTLIEGSTHVRPLAHLSRSTKPE